MVSETPRGSMTDPSPPVTDNRSPLPAAVQQRLRQVFDHANRCFEKGDHDYAHDLFTQCVAEDPGNLTALQHFRANLAKRAAGTKKSVSFGGLLNMSGRGAVDKAVSKAKWEEAHTAACQALKKNDADIGVLQAWATALGQQGYVECQLYCLRWALDCDTTDIETNRQAAMALAGVGEFDQAIACWQRVQQKKPQDEESAKQIARLSVEKTIHKGGYDTELLKKDTTAGNGESAQPSTPRVADLAAKQSDGTPRDIPTSGPFRDGTTAYDNGDSDFETQERELLDAIAAAPEEVDHYLQIAQLYASENRLQDAERLLNKGVSSTKDPAGTLRDRLEDVYLERVRQQVEVARKRVEAKQDEESKKLLARMVSQANRAELEVYTARAERSPGDTKLHFERGIRQKRLGQHRDAINSFQAARGDSRRLAETQIHLGECFQHIEQYKLALSSYEAAVEASESGDEAVRKLALYRAGVLATGLKDLDRAEQRLTELAALDFSYRDVAERLDKIASMRKDT